jgi:hypothetical protein
MPLAGPTADRPSQRPLDALSDDLSSGMPETPSPVATRGVPETSPAWELELIISGAIVVGLFQLPGLIASLFDRLEPHATMGMLVSLSVLHMYVLAAAYALIIVFTVHLSARAYWVALIGLHSVFPGGVRWTELKAGPAAMDVYRRHLRALPSAIERIDNFCSIAFSFAFLIVMMLVYSVVLVGVASGLGYLIAKVIGHGQDLNVLAPALVALIVLPTLAMTVLDRRFANRNGPDAEPPRWLRRGLRVALVLNPTTMIVGPIMFTLMTNIGRRKIRAVLIAALLSVIVVASVDRLNRANKIALNSYDFFAMSREHGVNYRFYENQRPEGALADRVPFIQSDVVTDRYVKLFVPYLPAVDNAAVTARCPRLAPLDSRGLHLHSNALVADSLAGPALDCLAALHAVTLDGKPLEQPGFAFYEQPKTGERGILAYIPADSLAPGRHELSVNVTVNPEDSAGVKGYTPPKPWVIAFWR